MTKRRRSAKKRSSGSYEVFLSHSHKDAWLATVIAAKVRAARIKVWLDEMSLEGGEQVLDGILKGISRTNETVVLVSDASMRSQWVATEIGMAKAKKKRVTPLLNNVDSDALVPLKGVKTYELNAFPRFLTELRERARGR